MNNRSSERERDYKYVGVGTMKDWQLKLMDIEDVFISCRFLNRYNET